MIEGTEESDFANLEVGYKEYVERFGDVYKRQGYISMSGRNMNQLAMYLQRFGAKEHIKKA